MEVAVLGVDHEELGQEVKAIVVPVPGATIDTQHLAEWVAETLAPFKVPAHWEVRETPLPRNAVGKVMKHLLVGEGTMHSLRNRRAGSRPQSPADAPWMKVRE